MDAAKLISTTDGERPQPTRSGPMVWMGEGDAYQYVEIYAQWGDKERALRWLETAWRLRDAGLEGLRVDFLLDPLRHESRFQAIERELKFPD